MACASDLKPNGHCCARCALPLPQSIPLCGDCLQRAPAFDAAFAPFLYGHPLDLLMTKLKFGRSLAAGRVLAELWAAALHEALHARASLTLPRCLIPVPLHVRRLHERGYNQALELAKPLAREFGLDLRPDLLKRLRATAAQSDLDAKARRKNLRGAFEFNRAAGLKAPFAATTKGQQLSGLRQLPNHVALVDDVMTTGTTLHECARVLKRAGIERVDVWALARAPRGR